MGSDAALSAVVTRLMRIDAMWISVGFVPVVDDGETSVVAQNWQLSTVSGSGEGRVWRR